MYAAKQGDIILFDFNPQSGREQAGTRPALIVSNDDFHQIDKGMAMVCPITNTKRGLPTEVYLDQRTQTQGTILCGQAKILDLKSRKHRFLESIPQETLEEVIDILSGIIEIPN